MSRRVQQLTRKLRALAVAAVVLIALAVAGAVVVATSETGGSPPAIVEPDLALYNRAHHESRGGEIIVRGDRPQEGLFFRYALEPTKNYLVNMKGEAVAGAAAIRWIEDGGRPRYSTAPSGSMRYVVSDTSRLEVLVYGEDRFEYRFSLLEVRECTDCFSDLQIERAAASIVPTRTLARPTVAAYNLVAVAKQPDALVISGDAPQEGVSFKFTLDTGKRYAAIVTGEPDTGAPAIRWVAGTNEPHYTAAPNGTHTYIVAQASDLEILLYGEEQFTYALQVVRLIECHTCLTLGEIPKTVRSLLPEGTRPLLKRVEPYAGGALRPTADGLSIENLADAGGLRLTFATSPSTRYIAGVQGATRRGHASIYVQKGETPGFYIPAGRVVREFVHEGEKELSMIIFGSGVVTYHLRSVYVTPCASCPTDSDLRALILTETPRLDAALRTDRPRAAELLLHWASNALDWSVNPRLALESTIQGLTAADLYYRVYRANRGAVFCTGAATFYRQILELFDFEALQISFGETVGGLTHSTIVVPHRTPAKTEYLLFDPSFNASFRDTASGDFLDIRTLVDRATRGEVSAIRVDHQPLHNREFVAQTQSERAGCIDAGRGAGDFVRCRWRRFDIHAYLTYFQETFAALGYARGVEGFFELLRNRLYDVEGNRRIREQFLADVGTTIPSATTVGE